MFKNAAVISLATMLAVSPAFAQEEAQSEGQASEEAQPEEQASPEASSEAVPTSDAVVPEQEQPEMRADWITGATIMSTSGERIGPIQDIMIDSESGQVTAAIVGVGGFLGIGTKQIAVAWDQLQIDYDGQEVQMDLTREEAEAAPEYVFRERQQPPAPEPATDGTGTGGESTGGMGTGTGTTATGGTSGMATGGEATGGGANGGEATSN
ncbi:PRC-barrel domain-containing protein [Tranquillimonas rosea]|uniref:PRC-barrel domain-containing protein n=1 Tax=Tranquillimonas rosea TaxID=641238 RepID=UPI003BAB0D92